MVNILEQTRITENWNPIEGWRRISLEVRRRARYWPLLEDALTDMGPKALDLFEADPPDVLSNRLMWLYRLMWNDLPVYTREELIQLTEAFIKNQEENKEHLIDTGYRNKVLQQKFPWLEKRLGNLYPTKLYESFTQDRERLGVLSFSWATLDSNGNKVQCSYEEAPAFDILDKEQAQYINKLRPELFDLKMTILHRLLTILKAGPLDDHENNDFQEIFDLIQEHDMETLILTDNMLSGKGRIPNARPGGRKHICDPGGLSGMLEVACHYLTESQTDFYHETKTYFGSSFREDRKGYQNFNTTPFAAMCDDDPFTIGQKLDAICEGLVKASDRLDDLDLIVVGNDELMIRLKGNNLSLALKNHLKSTKERLAAKPSRTNVEIPNRFVQRNNLYFIKYKGKEVTIAKTVGLCDIAHIIIRQPHGVDTGDLLSLCGTKSDYTHETSMEAIDPKAIQQNYTRQIELEREIEKLRSDNPESDISRLVKERDDIEDYLNENVRWKRGKNGKQKPVPKHTGGDNTGASSITQNRSRAYKKLDKCHKVLSNHLRKYIKRHKFKFYYEPKPPVQWHVDLG